MGWEIAAMRSDSRILALPAELRQQVLAMPLTEDEQDDVASALLSLTVPPQPGAFYLRANKNAPQPYRLRGV